MAEREMCRGNLSTENIERAVHLFRNITINGEQSNESVLMHFSPKIWCAIKKFTVSAMKLFKALMKLHCEMYKSSMFDEIKIYFEMYM